jgi:hypothetical protein
MEREQMERDRHTLLHFPIRHGVTTAIECNFVSFQKCPIFSYRVTQVQLKADLFFVRDTCKSYMQLAGRTMSLDLDD